MILSSSPLRATTVTLSPHFRLPIWRFPHLPNSGTGWLLSRSVQKTKPSDSEDGGVRCSLRSCGQSGPAVATQKTAPNNGTGFMDGHSPIRWVRRQPDIAGLPVRALNML
jgi:hypothetical protein